MAHDESSAVPFTFDCSTDTITCQRVGAEHMSQTKTERLVLVTPTISEHRAVRPFVRGPAAEGVVETALCGIGPDCAARFGRYLDERETLPSSLALVGVAGGLDPSLAAGDVILASEARDEKGRRAPCTVVPLTGATVGSVLTVSRALHTPAEKAAARDTGAVAVEMEAYPLAAWAACRGLPFIHARVILDPAAETLPDLRDVLDSYGRARPAGLLRHLLAHPAQAGTLIRFLRQSQAVASTLGRLARAVVTVHRI
jgi:nucleoside phosphorylase